MINSSTYEEQVKNYKLLNAWAKKFKELNPKSQCIIEWNAHKEFKRLFFMNAASKTILEKSSQDVAMTDCAFMKGASYNGQFMASSIVDGNLNNVLLSCALVPSENRENYDWFYEKTKDTLGDSATILNNEKFSHLSDRDKGLESATDNSFLEANNAHCFKHITANIRCNKDIPKLGANESFLWKVRNSKTKVEFDQNMELLKMINIKAAAYLEAIPGGHDSWTLYRNIEKKIPLFGHATSNVIESENSRYLPARKQEPFGFLDTVVNMTLKQNNKGRDNALKWENEGMLITPNVQQKLNANESEAKFYHGVRVHSREAIVKRGSSSEHRVKFHETGGECDCGEWEQDQVPLPCRHANAARKILNFKPLTPEWYQYAISGIYSVEKYKQAYDSFNIVPPLKSELEPDSDDDEMKPPEVYKTPGRRAKKRKRKRTEGVNGGPVQIRRCSRCKSTEHDIRRCPQKFL